MTVKTILLLVMLFGIALAFSCKPPKETDDPTTLVREMEMQTSPCYGKCPYYVMTIYKGGIIRYQGKKFVEKFGLYTKKLSKSEYKAIKKMFVEADFWSFEDSYASNIPDIPKTRLTFIQNGKTKNIVGDINRPKVIKELEKAMEAIGNNKEGWTMRSVPNPEIQDFYITDELIISLNPETDPKEWVKKYERWNMEIKKPISPNRNLWLFKYDNPNLNPSQVMNLLSIDEDVMILEFNKKVESRGRD